MVEDVKAGSVDTRGSDYFYWRGEGLQHPTNIIIICFIDKVEGDPPQTDLKTRESDGDLIGI